MKKIKTSKKNLIILLTFVMLLSATFLPLTANANSVDLGTSDLTPKTSQISPSTVRVAIYNEPNVTEPFYSTSSLLTNNYTALKTLLEGEGYQVSELTCNDIYDHKLMTADYDVFIMVDNVPRENITNHVKEFWLGGGGVLSFDSALSYLLYAGIMIPESEGDENIGTYWYYGGTTSHNISIRHPATKEYQVNDKFSSAGTTSCSLDWGVLLTTSVGANVIKLANDDGTINDASAVALDPSSKGGRVAQLPGRGDYIGTNMSNLITDTIDWLCPRPKGRILFDLSHLPYYGIDAWDISYTDYAPRYEILRDNLVNRSYTFDKLYPSATGNLTTSNLLPYDMLILCVPELNFTSNEVSAVTQWVNDGGGLIAIGENSGFADENNNINYLYGSYDLQMVSVTGTSAANFIVEHPTVEGCTEISASAPGTIDYSGNAYPIWGYDDSEIYVAGQEYGSGRVLLMSDLAAFRDSTINTLNNLQYAINMVNWLSSSNADVLLYVDEPFSPNFYQTPVARALNLLEIPFYLTFDKDYTNLSLHLYTWDMLIVDNVNYFINAFYYDVADYVNTGGSLIMSTYTVNHNPTHPLWSLLGFELSANIPSEPTFHIWNPTHAIFTTPIAYGATNFLSDNSYADDGDLLTVFSNATALAGFTPTEQAGNATIVLGNSGKTLFNSILVDKYSLDTDDSTYEDRLELWINEISFMRAQIIVDGPIEDGIPEYIIYIIIIGAVVLIGVISIIALRKKRKNK